MKTIGFIGCGNMAQPIIRNTAEKCVFERKDIFVFDTDKDKLSAFCSKTGVCEADSGEAIAQSCDVVVLCTKPQVFPLLLPVLAPYLEKNRPLIVSIAAGKTTRFINDFLPYDAAVARIFPNLNAEVGEAVSAYTGNENVTAEQLETVEKICSAYGEAIKLDEDCFSAFGVLGGCAPAYTFMFIDSLAKAGTKAGLDADLSLKTAIQTVLGSARLLKAGVGLPDEMVKKVCSPGGTTIEGVTVLKDDGLEELVGKAFKASFDKDKKV